ncbi:hypothetical protein AVEN_32913-1 [Araneus ventricosus]|uniref:BACK domain-containing protein n=1 Tax=Araneus ventricosus TaxID=182803 RepID=A0A4Y2PMG4_ARAVE|nr:hypothetical protein AVEN_32913-1 [Araneus ventricosus]
MDDLLKSCDSFVTQNITFTNCLAFLTVASQFNRLAILNDCYRYALVHFEDILETSNCGLVALPFEVLRKLLESNSLNVVSERSVWRAIVSWTEANSSTRLPHVPILLTCLKLDEEVDGNPAEEILSHPIVSRNPHIFGLTLGNQVNFHTLKRAMLSQCASLDPRYQDLPSSRGPRMPNFLHLIARYKLNPTSLLSSGDGSELFLTYDNELDSWRRIGEQNYHIETMTRIGQRIYTFSMAFPLLCIFDIVEEVW